MLWQRNSLMPFCFLLTMASIDASAQNTKRQQYIDAYIKFAFESGKLERLRKIKVADAIPIEVICSIPSEAMCREVRATLSHSVHTSTNVKFKFDGFPILRIEFFDQSNAESIRKAASEEFLGKNSDVSDTDCQAFYQLDGSDIARAKILVAGYQPERKLGACIITQVGLTLGLGTVDGRNFKTLWNLQPRGLDDLDDSGIKTMGDAYSFYEHIHMCPEIHAGQTRDEARRVLELPESCISKIGGVN